MSFHSSGRCCLKLSVNNIDVVKQPDYISSANDIVHSRVHRQYSFWDVRCCFYQVEELDCLRKFAIIKFKWQWQESIVKKWYLRNRKATSSLFLVSTSFICSIPVSVESTNLHLIMTMTMIKGWYAVEEMLVWWYTALKSIRLNTVGFRNAPAFKPANCRVEAWRNLCWTLGCSQFLDDLKL